MAKRSGNGKTKIETLLEVWICESCRTEKTIDDSYETSYLDVKERKCEFCNKLGNCYLVEIGRKKNC